MNLRNPSSDTRGCLAAVLGAPKPRPAVITPEALAQAERDYAEGQRQLALRAWERRRSA